MSDTTQDRLDRIEKAIHEGVLSVSHNGRTVTYRSLAEMERIAASLRRAISGATTRPRVSGFAFERGRE